MPNWEAALISAVSLIWSIYADVQQSDEYWEALIAEADVIAKKHQNNKLCRDLVHAAMAELEGKARKW